MNKKKRKIKYIELLPIIILAILSFRIINKENLISGFFNGAIAIFAPFIWAIAIAYLVGLMISFFEKKFKMKRIIALIVSYLLVFALIVAFFVLVIPLIAKSVPKLADEFYKYGNNFNDWYHSSVEGSGKLSEASKVYGIDFDVLITEKMESFLQIASENVQSFILKIGETAFSITTVLVEFFIGLVASIYILLDQENLFKQTKKLSNTFFGEKFTNKMSSIIKDTDEVFGQYLIGKSLDSLIIGIIAFIGFKVLRIEFAPLLAIIVGVTNMIPYFGPIIGAVPSVLITLFIDPLQALWVLIFILILQQLDGNIIGPKIVGDKLGLPPLWMVVAVFVGGKLFGFWGMLLGTPVFALFRKRILDKQDILLEQRAQKEEHNG